MLTELKGRVAVVTGAASGIGAALCAALAGEGMRVVAADIDAAGAEATAAALPEATAVAVDVADPASVNAFADAAFAAWGAVDLLINNAGVFQGGLMWERSAADWEWTFGVNLFGITNAVRSFVPRMIAQGTEGHIVNTASVAAFGCGCGVVALRRLEVRGAVGERVSRPRPRRGRLEDRRPRCSHRARSTPASRRRRASAPAGTERTRRSMPG